MSRTDAIAQLQSIRQDALEYLDADTVANEVAALTMAIKALQAPRRDTPIWACALWCIAAAIIGVACVIYAMA